MVSRSVVVVRRVAAAAQAQVDPAVDGHPIMETGTAVTHVPAGPEVPAAGGREAPAAAGDQATLAGREEDDLGSLPLRMTATTATTEVTASDRT